MPLSCSELLLALVAGEGVCTTNILEEKRKEKRGHLKNKKIRHDMTMQGKSKKQMREGDDEYAIE